MPMTKANDQIPITKYRWNQIAMVFPNVQAKQLAPDIVRPNKLDSYKKEEQKKNTKHQKSIQNHLVEEVPFWLNA
jgi:hypothetical protein